MHNRVRAAIFNDVVAHSADRSGVFQSPASPLAVLIIFFTLWGLPLHGVEAPLAFSLFLCTVHLNVYFSIIREQNSMKIDRHILDTYVQALTEP